MDSKLLSPPLPDLHDSFSRLPDELVVYILSRMPLNEAARTCTVSRRFQALWPYSTGKLDFTNVGLRVTANVLIQRVNQALRSHKGLTMDGFMLKLHVWRGGHSHQCDINAWIEEALAKSVNKLHLESYGDQYFQYSLSRGGMFSFIKTPRGSSQIRSLTSVFLEEMGVDGDFLEYLLANCPLLEHLHVYQERLSTFTIDGASLKLRRLSIFGPLKSLVITCAPNLETFTYYGNLPALEIRGAHRLRYLSAFEIIRNEERLLSSKCCLTGLQTLTLGVYLSPVSALIYEKLPAMPCLRHMIWKLHPHPQGFWSVFEACPLLQKLTVEVPNWKKSDMEGIKEPVLPAPLKFLKEIELVGFIGHDIVADLATYLFESALTLERVVVQGRPVGFFYSKYVPKDDLQLLPGSIGKGVRMLKKKLPPNVKLVINTVI